MKKLSVWIYLALTLMVYELRADGTEINSKYEENLRKDLFTNVDGVKHTRPLTNHNSSVVIDVLLDIVHIRNLDESSGTITVNGLLKLSWIDETFQWDSYEYGGISHLVLPHELIWTPDISPYNGAEAAEIGKFEHASIYLHSDGSVQWIPQVTLTTTCLLDHQMFPFDQQYCSILLGSWAHDTSAVQLKLSEEHNSAQVTLLPFYTENPQWELYNVLAYPKHLFTEECCTEPYNAIEYKLHLRRKSSMQKIIIGFPCLIATMLTMAIYWFPPNETAKITLGGIVLLVQVALLLFMGWYIPQGGTSIPIIVVYCGTSLILTGLTVIVSIMVINISRSKFQRSPVPSICRLLMNGTLHKLLCIKSCQYQKRNTKLLDENHVELGDTGIHNGGHSLDDNHSVSTNTDWIIVATVIDRVCFVLYCTAILVVIISTFSKY